MKTGLQNSKKSLWRSMENSSICPSSELCGGCLYQGVEYSEQLRIKENEVRSYLENNGIDPGLLIGIKPCPVITSYRNKMEYSFGDQVKGGEMHLGLHQRGHFMNIIDVSSCSLVTDDFNTLIKATLEFANEKFYVHYNKKSHKGFLRNLIIRRGVRTGQLLINIVTSSEEVFDGESYKEKLLSLKLQDEIVGILHTISDTVADVVKCDSMDIIYGRDYYEEIISGLKFKIGPFSFFQTNVDAAERLYSDAVSLIDHIDGKTVFDLYCGTGTISQIVAKNAKKVIGVEIVEEAVNTARESAILNNIDNCTFIAEDVNKALSSIEDKPDVIIVDPPRSGIVPKAMKQILSYGVDQIIYISCNPKTMAVNIKNALEEGYRIEHLMAYDNFPMTKHIESVCLLTK